MHLSSDLKGQYHENTSTVEKVPQVLRSNDFMDFGRKCRVAHLIKSYFGYIPSDLSFFLIRFLFRMTQPSHL